MWNNFSVASLLCVCGLLGCSDDGSAGAGFVPLTPATSGAWETTTPAASDDSGGSDGSTGGPGDDSTTSAGPAGSSESGGTSSAGNGSDESSSTGSEIDESDDPVVVCERWERDHAPIYDLSWDGDLTTCDAGDISEEERARGLAKLNLYRWLAGLRPVSEHIGLRPTVQECALIMGANLSLSHHPGTDWECYSSEGAEGASNSNIALGAFYGTVDSFMHDGGESNAPTLGHRRWVLSSNLVQAGIGSTDRSGCFAPVTGPPEENLFTAFPSPGPFPIEPFEIPHFSGPLDEVGWSVHSQALDLREASVSISVDGVAQPIEVRPLTEGLGPDRYAIAMRPMGWQTQAGTTYHVELAGLSVPISYDVDVVDCSPGE